MSVKVSVHELHEQLPELLDRTVESGEACIIQRDGQDYAVLVSAREWERRTHDPDSARSRAARIAARERRRHEVGRALDAVILRRAEALKRIG